MKANSRKGGLQDNALLEQVFPKHIAAALREGRTVGTLDSCVLVSGGLES